MIRENQALWQRAPLLVHNADQLIGSLKPGSYLCWERDPGRVLGRLILDRPGLEGPVEQLYDVQLEAGSVQWVKVSFNTIDERIVTERLDADAGKALVAASAAASGIQLARTP